MDEPQSSNVSASEIDEETMRKLKGDMIGDTLYSESFVIKLLLNLSDLKCTDEMEQDLCFLWDMTVEKDVCKFLFDMKYPALASVAVVSCANERFIEILVGILANILLADCERSITETEIKLILKELETEDTSVLIQLMRFIEAFVYFMPEHITFIGKDIMENRIQFILKYSVNSELLIQTMQALVRLTEDFKLSYCLVNSSLFEAVIDGFDTIYSVETTCFEDIIDTDEARKNFRIFLNLICSICAYAQKFLHEDGIPNAINSCEKLALIICKILRFLANKKNLYPITPDFDEYISTFETIITTRDVNIVQNIGNGFFNNIFSDVCRILYLLYDCKYEVLDSFSLVLKFVGCLIYLVDEKMTLTEFKKIKYAEGIIVLNSLKESSRGFDFDISDKLKYLFAKFK